MQKENSLVDLCVSAYKNTHRDDNGGSMENKIQKKLFSISEFIEAYSISRSQFYLLLKNKKIKTVKLGSRKMIRLEDAESWADSLERVK